MVQFDAAFVKSMQALIPAGKNTAIQSEALVYAAIQLSQYQTLMYGAAATAYWGGGHTSVLRAFSCRSQGECDNVESAFSYSMVYRLKTVVEGTLRSELTTAYTEDTLASLEGKEINYVDKIKSATKDKAKAFFTEFIKAWTAKSKSGTPYPTDVISTFALINVWSMCSLIQLNAKYPAGVADPAEYNKLIEECYTIRGANVKIQHGAIKVPYLPFVYLHMTQRAADSANIPTSYKTLLCFISIVG
jgi:hypothetical protein